jgi:tagatose-6-phosphate ketose/aldose isomerase
MDMIEELRSDGVAAEVVAISAQPDLAGAIHVRDLEQAEDSDLQFPYIVPAQLFALHASLQRALDPDNPNKAGTVSRVVQGVRIHARK